MLGRLRRPWKPSPSPRLMTCCIAAACDHNRIIVTASDTRVSYGFASTDEILKLVRIQYPYWLGMIAGDDISVGAETVTRLIADTLAAYDAEPPTAVQVRAAIVGAWRDVQNQLGQAATLNALRMDVQTFREKGRDQLGDEVFFKLLVQLQATSRLHCDLLAVGFDEQKIPTLFVCNDEYPACADVSRNGYTAIGSGHTLAMAMLSLQNYSVSADLRSAIYQVCAAKFIAEKADGVGERTVVMCIDTDGKTCVIQGEPIKELKAIWEKHGQPRNPGLDLLRCLGPSVANDRWGTL